MKLFNKDTLRTDKGRSGEDVVASYLEKHGFFLRARNFELSIGEVDIIAEKEGVIHFVEVKSFWQQKQGRAKEEEVFQASEKVDQRKLRTISQVAGLYLEREGMSERDWCIDVCVVRFSHEGGVYVTYMPEVT